MRRLFLFALALTTACGDNRPSAPTAEESQQLNEAEAMLNDLNEEGPALESTGPSNSSTD